MMRSDIPQSLLGEEFATPRREFTMSTVCEHQGKMLHKATGGKFEFYADEPPALGGEDNHPQPLRYIAAGIGF